MPCREHSKPRRAADTPPTVAQGCLHYAISSPQVPKALLTRNLELQFLGKQKALPVSPLLSSFKLRAAPSSRAEVLNLWVKWPFHKSLTSDIPVYQIFTLQFITVSQLQLGGSNRSNCMVGGGSSQHEELCWRVTALGKWEPLQWREQVRGSESQKSSFLLTWTLWASSSIRNRRCKLGDVPSATP